MNLYHVFIDLKDDAKALQFAKQLEEWLGYLSAKGVIGDWRLLRRKLNLASTDHGDFLLEIEFEDLAHLDRAFRQVGSDSESVERLYYPVNSMIARVRVGLYRPFPDPERAERMAIL